MVRHLRLQHSHAPPPPKLTDGSNRHPKVVGAEAGKRAARRRVARHKKGTCLPGLAIEVVEEAAAGAVGTAVVQGPAVGMPTLPV